MNRLLAFLISAVICLIAGNAFPAHPNFYEVTHRSEVLGREATFTIHLPEGAGPDNRHPTLYLLHGAYGNHGDWPSRSPVSQLVENYPMILVFPDGGEFGWYLDSPMEEDSQYESYLIGELLPLVDRMFPTLGTRETRGIMGLSMGGHGAMTLAARHPDLFSSVSSLSGILKLTNHSGKWQINERLGPLEGNETLWAAHSAWELATIFSDTPGMRILFDCGREDTVTGAWQDSVAFHERLLELEVPHIWRPFPGGHNWEYWSAHLPGHLNFHQANFMEHQVVESRAVTHYFNRLRVFFDEIAAATLEPAPTLPTLCLLGSSSAEGMQAGLFPGHHVYNRGISSDVLGIFGRGISHRMEESVFDMKPDIIVIKNARNDLGDRARNGEPSISQMIGEYDRILTKISERLPDSRVIVTTSFPTRGRFSHLAPEIQTFNEELIRMVERHPVTLIDIHPLLKEDDSLLLREEFTTDGLHLSEGGKRLWAGLILEALETASPGAP